MKLFGLHADVRDPAKLKLILADALAQQAIIVAAFLDEAIRKAAADASQAKELPQVTPRWDPTLRVTPR